MVRRSGRSTRRTGEGQLDLLVAVPGDIPTHDQQDIRQGKRKKPEGFHWIERYAAPTDEQGRPAGIEFTISDWLYEGILTDRLTLTIDREYFSLTGGIEQWLYRVVRKHGGHQSGGWAFTTTQLHMKSGSTQRLADFAKELRRTIERQRLPGYWLQILRNSEGNEVLHFTEWCQLPTYHHGFSPRRLPRTSIGLFSPATARGQNHDTESEREEVTTGSTDQPVDM